jgi:hypothetical protein
MTLLTNEALYDPSNLQDILSLCDTFNSVTKDMAKSKTFGNWFKNTDIQMMTNAVRIL